MRNEPDSTRNKLPTRDAGSSQSAKTKLGDAPTAPHEEVALIGGLPTDEKKNPEESEAGYVAPQFEDEMTPTATSFVADDVGEPLEVSTPFGFWCEAICLTPLLICGLPLVNSASLQWQNVSTRVPLIVGILAAITLIVFGRYRGIRLQARVQIAFGMIAASFFCAIASWLNASLAWPLLAIGFGLTAWTGLRLLNERITRGLAVAATIFFPVLASSGLWMQIKWLASRLCSWTTSGLLDLANQPHLRNLSIIEIGGGQIQVPSIALEWNGLAACLAIAAFFAVLMRRSLLVSMKLCVCSVLVWITLTAIQLAILGESALDSAGGLTLSSQITHFGLCVFAIAAFDQFLGQVYAPIHADKFESDFPVVTQLWNIVSMFPEPAIRLERLGGEFVDEENEEEIAVT